MSVVRIRAGSVTDLSALRGLFRRSSLYNESDRELLRAYPEALELSDAGITEGRTRVAVVADNKIVGFITTLALRGRVLEIEDLFVEPDWMRKGVASHLVEDLVATARQSGVWRIEVTANPHANAFYRRLGFTRDHDTETPFGPAPRMCLILRGDEADPGDQAFGVP